MNHYKVIFVHKYDNFKCEMSVWAESELEALKHAMSLPEVYQVIRVLPWKDLFELTPEQMEFSALQCDLIMKQLNNM